MSAVDYSLLFSFETIEVVLLNIIFLYVLHFVLQPKVADWNSPDRGFSKMNPLWGKIFTQSFLFGITFSLLIWVLSSGVVFLTLLGAMLSYVFFFSSAVDIQIYKAPREVSNYGFVFSTIIMLIVFATHFLDDYFSGVNVSTVNGLLLEPLIFFDNLIDNQLFNVFSWFAVIVILQFISRGGLGMADVRLFFLLGVTLAWWAGFNNMLIVFAAANIIQALAFIPGTIFKWGHLVTMRNGKQKRAIPFIPAISLTFLVSFAILVSDVQAV